MTPVNQLLERLELVKQTGKDRWLACCPAHEDRSPSLSVSETDEGNVLVHCFAGCETRAVVNAVGLELRDLFPSGTADRVKCREYPQADYRATLREIRHWLWVLQLVASDIVEGRQLTAAELGVVSDAKRCIENALEVGNV
jgi:hypothetical protein